MNFYTGSGLERVSHLRGDAKWLEGRLRDPASRLTPVWRERNLILGLDGAAEISGGWLTVAASAGLIAAAQEVVLLGEVAGVAHFALDISPVEEPAALPELPEAGEFVGLRDAAPSLGREEASMLAYAKGLMHWHGRHKYCGVCAAPTESREAGHVRKCSNPDCSASHFPRTDPAVIVLVSRGDRCLLGHNKRFVERRYSTIAGFVEPGESLEEAVAREVMEETGVVAGNARYHSSQPWPFPASLMLGFHAEGLSEAVTVDQTELADARWFGRDEIRDADNRGFSLPPPDSIARQLIEHWLKTG